MGFNPIAERRKNMAKYKIAVTDDRYGGEYDWERKVLAQIDAELVIYNCSTAQEVIEKCADADGILCNLAPMPAEVIGALNKCKVIARYGVGFDNVDVAACTQKGIYVTNVSDYCAEDVSDQALALLLGCVRKIARRDAQVRAGMWNIGRSEKMYRIAGKTFAFLGFGMIARCLYRKLSGLNLARVLVYDPYIDAETLKSMGVEKVEWEDALRQADYISVHMPLNESTKGIVNAKAFKLMKNTAIIVNTSRGPVIDQAAIIDALKSGEIAYAGLDVHTVEPIEKDNPLLEIENCILSDHTGWYSEESFGELKSKAAQNIVDVLNGKKPKYAVNNIN